MMSTEKYFREDKLIRVSKETGLTTIYAMTNIGTNETIFEVRLTRTFGRHTPQGVQQIPYSKAFVLNGADVVSAFADFDERVKDMNDEIEKEFRDQLEKKRRELVLPTNPDNGT